MGDGKYRLFVVDDDCAICEFIEGEYRDRFQIASAYSHHDAMRLWDSEPFDIALIDLKLPLNSDDPDPNEQVGYDLIKRIRHKDARVQIIVMTAHHRSSETTVRAMKNGANDYITKPFDNAEISLDAKIDEGIARLVSFGEAAYGIGKAAPALPIGKAAPAPTASRKKSDGPSGGFAISPPRQTMQEIRKRINSVAKTDASILITGETGVGKGHWASVIYEKSKQTGKFIIFNCSMNPTIIESELFGHVKGAFTGADKDRPGHIAAAENGTLFLDEIGAMPFDAQSKLLIFLDDKIVRPMGATSGSKVNVRIIAATNADIQEAIEAGTLRNDLFHRLNDVWIHIPPLRERKDEIPALCRELLKKRFGGAYANKKRISREEKEKLKEYSWPGNIRELEKHFKNACGKKGRDILASDVIGNK